jgi:hypothetical protein
MIWWSHLKTKINAPWTGSPFPSGYTRTNVLHTFSIYGSLPPFYVMSISSFILWMKMGVTSNRWHNSVLQSAILLPFPTPLTFKSSCPCLYSLLFSFIFYAFNCCLLETFIQSLAEIQLLATRNSSCNLNNTFRVFSQSYSKRRREQNMPQTDSKKVEWKWGNGKFISPNILFYYNIPAQGVIVHCKPLRQCGC